MATRVPVNPPEIFTGDKTKFSTFLRQLKLNFVADSASFANDQAKIIYALSFMRDNTAGAWSEAFIDEAISKNSWDKWSEFEAKLTKSFGDPNEHRNAQDSLDSLRQGKRTAEDYFLEFDQLARIAGYATGHDDELIRVLEKNVNPSLIDKVYNAETLPTTYDQWRTKIIALDQLARRREMQRQINRSFWSDKKDFRPVARQMEKSSPSEGKTYSGAGQPMDVDRVKSRSGIRCYNCEQMGHFAKECKRGSSRAPKQNVNIRLETVLEMDEQEQKKIWEELEEKFGKKGFVQDQE